MKKIFLIACSVLMFSCSNDDVTMQSETVNALNVNSDFREKSGATFESLYSDFFYSKDFESFTNDSDLYFTKMNYPGDIAILADKGATLKWVKNNLSSTGFTTYGQAESDYNNLEALSGSIISSNEVLFDLISITPVKDVIIGIGVVTLPVNETANEVCIYLYKDCKQDALDSLNHDLAVLDGHFGSTMGSVILHGAYALEIADCRFAYNKCKGSIW